MQQHLPKKILIILSSHGKLGGSGKPTGWWLSELTHFCDVVEKAGFTYDIASPLGGEAPMDPASYDIGDSINKKFFEDEVFLGKIKNTLKPSDIQTNDYVAVFYPGGHGPMYDLATDRDIAKIAATIYEQGGTVSAVCHGPAALLPIKLQNGEALINEHVVTGLSNFEEWLVRKHKWVPFMLETELKKQAKHYTKALLPGLRHIEISGRIVTGQNPRSTHDVAKAVVELLKGN